jgi:hypothetical protein
MMRPTLAIALASFTLAGCAESTPAPTAAPGFASHRPGAWQQFCEQSWNVQHASSLAAARGAEGWELVAMYNGVLCYKRPTFDARPQVAPAGTTSAPTVPQIRDPGF